MKIVWIIIIGFTIMSCSANKSNGVTSKNDSLPTTEVDIDTIIKPDKSNIYDIVSSVVRDSAFRAGFCNWIKDNLSKGRIHDRNYIPESIVLGHIEEDTIIGNFDGKGIDTLYIQFEECGCKERPFCKHSDNRVFVKYYLVSKKGRIPKTRLLADASMPPRVVNEGDLDGDGKSEIGYMYTWGTSQWRTYRILTFHKNEWRYLIDPQKEYMSTSRLFRFSGYEIAEKGKKKGTILVHYLPEGLNQNVQDIIVEPSYVKIDDVEE